ncbi:MAG TPA: UDP-N-acetylmuramate--L-alanine ligase [Candidatus Babeliales bacterium]|nr:UDP-N-acetylmuramate--L-alanine ligase [Candidatus Babeliales bacterium]
MYLKKAHIHFMGIGGIGMSGIAKILKYQGYKISGCDLSLEQQSVQDLLHIGCQITNQHNTGICHDPSIDVLVYSSAIKPDNPELLAAQARHIPIIPRALMLAELMRTKYGISITGAHGKTTTTSMVSQILIEAGMNPTVIIGGHLKSIATNAQWGNGDFLVAEVDESDRSLLHLQSTIAVVTNIDLEHLETYRDLDDIKATFQQFLSNLPFYGKAIVCIDDPNIQAILPQIKHVKTLRYGTAPTADVYPTDIELAVDHSTCTVWHQQQPLGLLRVNMPGRHNLLNALAAVTVGMDLQIPFAVIATALKNFPGVLRRFSYNGRFKGAEIFDDYGHHPNEISHTLTVARKRTKNKLHVVFQPHRYTRTDRLWQQFLATFAQQPVDQLLITDIYPASEAPIANVTSARLVQELKQLAPNLDVRYLPLESDFTSIIQQLQATTNPDDLILLLGAGKVNQIAKLLI